MVKYSQEELTKGQDLAVGPVDVDAALRAASASGDDVGDLEGWWRGNRVTSDLERCCSSNGCKSQGSEGILHFETARTSIEQ